MSDDLLDSKQFPQSGAPPVRTTGGSTLWTPPSPEHLQRLLPQYEIISILGRGGMGAVYKGRQISLDRLVAIKLLPREAVEDNEEANFTERFKNEARSMAKMNHPAIVSVYDFGETSEGQLYIVMEYVDATDVAKMISEQKRLAPEHALAITAHVCDALDYAHSHGVIHRDIKPANVLMSMEGHVKIADFGLAKATDTGATAITKTNMAMGTPDFIAPEALISGELVDHRADLYAVGVMLYNMLTGKVPRGVFLPASKIAGTDPRYDAIVTKAMQTECAYRYQTAMELRRDLDVILTVPMLKEQPAPQQQQQPRSVAQKPVGRGPQPRNEGPPAVAKGVNKTDGRSAVVPKKLNIVLFVGIGAAVLVAVGAFLALKKPKPSMGGTASSAEAFAAGIARLSPKEQGVRVVERIKQLNGGVEFKASPRITNGRVEGLELSRIDASLQDLSPVRALKDLKHLVLLRIFNSADLECVRGLSLESVHLHGSKLSDISALKGMPLTSFLLTETNVTDLSPVADAPIETLHANSKPFSDLTSVKRMPLKHLNIASSSVRNLSPIKGMSIEELTCENGVAVDTLNRETLRSLKSLKKINGEDTAGFLKKLDSGTAPQNTPPPNRTAIQTLDLLALTDPVQDRVLAPPFTAKNEWKREGSGLLYQPDGKSGKLAPPVAFNCRDYEIEFKARKHSGNDRIHVDLPLKNGRIVPLILNSQSRKVLNEKDGNAWGGPADALVHVTIRVIDGEGASDRVVIERQDGKGNPLANWSGDLDTLAKGGEEHPAFPKQHVTSVFVMKDQYAVETWALRVFEGEARVLRTSTATPPPVVTTTPMPPATPATPASGDPRLAQLEAGFKARYESDAQKPYLAALATLNQNYIANGIGPARTAAQKKGALDEVTALDAEKARVENNEALPAADLDTLHASLKQVRGTYRTALVKIETERAKKGAPLYDLYLGALDVYIGELTKGNKIPEAQKVKTLRDDIAAQKTALMEGGTAPTPAKGPSTTPSTGTAPPKNTVKANLGPVIPIPPEVLAPPKKAEHTKVLVEWLNNRNAVRFGFSLGNKRTISNSTNKAPFPNGADLWLIDNGNQGRDPDFDAAWLEGQTDIEELRLHNLDKFSGPLGLRGMKKLVRLTLTGNDKMLPDEQMLLWPPLPALNEVTVQGSFGNQGLRVLCERCPQLTKLTVNSCKLTEGGLLPLQHLKNLTFYGQDRGTIPASELASLASLPKLDRLNFANIDLTGADFSLLSKLSIFIVSLSKFGDTEAKTLGNLKGLTDLRLEDTKITGASLPLIGALTKLQQLNLRGNLITDNSLVSLAGLKNLISLGLGNTATSDTGLQTICNEVPKLTDLSLTGTKVTDTGIPALKRLKQIEKLGLERTAITDGSVEHLKKLVTLKDLSVKDSNITQAGVDALKKALPQCKVTN